MRGVYRLKVPRKFDSEKNLGGLSESAMATLAMKDCVDEAKALLESTAVEREESLPSLHPSPENCSFKFQGSLAYRKTSGIDGSCVQKHALRPLSTASLNTNTRTT